MSNKIKSNLDAKKEFQNSLENRMEGGSESKQHADKKNRSTPAPAHHSPPERQTVRLINFNRTLTAK
jgi:hypothetical protein